MFRRQPQQAYALAWALSFYLAETRPRQYAQLVKLARRQGSAAAKARLKTFTQLFGSNFKWLQSDLVRFLNTLRPPLRR